MYTYEIWPDKDEDLKEGHILDQTIHTRVKDALKVAKKNMKSGWYCCISRCIGPGDWVSSSTYKMTGRILKRVVNLGDTLRALYEAYTSQA